MRHAEGATAIGHQRPERPHLAAAVAAGADSARYKFLLAAVLAVTLLLRAGWAAVAGVNVRARFLFDPTIYDVFANHLLRGNGFVMFDDKPSAFFPPGYPVILASLYKVFGTQLAVAWAANSVFATLTCLLVYAVGRRLFDPGVALGAAGLFALFPGDIFYAGLTMTEATFGCFFLGVIYLFIIWNAAAVSLWHWLIFGLALGALTLVRGVTLLYPAVPLAVWGASVGCTTSTIKKSAVIALGLAIVVAPWTVRNYVSMGYPILLAIDGPSAFFNAHNPLAFGGQTPAMHDLRHQLWPDLVGKPYSSVEVEQARREMRYGLDYMLAHPVREISQVPKRLQHLFEDDHWALNPLLNVLTPAWNRRCGLAADGYFYAVLLLALAGVRRAWNTPPAAILFFTLGYFLVLHGVLFFGESRYHAPLIPILCLFAALGARSLWSRGKQRFAEPLTRAAGAAPM